MYDLQRKSECEDWKNSRIEKGRRNGYREQCGIENWKSKMEIGTYSDSAGFSIKETLESSIQNRISREKQNFKSKT